MRRRFAILLLIVLLAGCGANSNEPLPDSIELLDDAATNIREVESFKMEVRREGAPYFIETIMGPVSFDRATMQYRAPESLQGQVRARLLGATIEFQVLARGESQWVKLPATEWDDSLIFAPGFNPEELIAEESGFQAALGALIDIEMLGRERLEDNSPVYHMSGRADGPLVTDLLVGLIEAEDEVLVEVFIHTETRNPLRVTITQPGTETEEIPEPTKWIVDIYDYNEPVEIEDPEA